MTNFVQEAILSKIRRDVLKTLRFSVFRGLHAPKVADEQHGSLHINLQSGKTKKKIHMI